MSQKEKLAFWKEEFNHCIKCYGCRNICPQCFCNVCTLEDEKWVETGRLPMPNASHVSPDPGHAYDGQMCSLP
jgi:formate dehydrogenase (coenzyme F420) beta subunit